MRALVKPDSEPYSEVMTENTWGRWTRNHLGEMVAAGWTLVENYIPHGPDE